MRIPIVLCLVIMNSAIAFGQFAEFSFKDNILKFDPLPEGTPLEFDFHFTNTGDVPLVISSYKVECPCTVVTLPSEPVMPGKSAIIHASFDSKGKMGWQYRKILLYANTKKEVEEIEFRLKVLNK